MRTTNNNPGVPPPNASPTLTSNPSMLHSHGITTAFTGTGTGGTITINSGACWDGIDGSVAWTSGRGPDKKIRKPRTPTLRPDPLNANIFITNRLTGRTKTFHTSLQVIAFLLDKDLNDFIITKDILLPGGSRYSVPVLPLGNSLEDLQVLLDSIV